MATGPEHYREAERLLKKVTHYSWGDGADPVTGAALAAEAQVHATLALAAAQSPAASGAQPETTDVYVYRAAWGMTPLGTYTISDAAREHCEADALNNSPEFAGGIFDWIGDESEPDDPYELVVAKDGVENTTDYTVTRIEVASEYDPEADA
ncbi:hypothetical protein ACFWFF_01360 [Streptomyces sp. NPDC060223]|uniref:hypothetical protein n=1 Tax=unclassified Streptomyces TaxID=2593676 RepID=UPI003630B75E